MHNREDRPENIDNSVADRYIITSKKTIVLIATLFSYDFYP
jgi:hypothetical protein